MPFAKLDGNNISNNIFSAFERTPGGSERLMNSIGLRDSVPAAKAGIASTQKRSPILSTGKLGDPINSIHDGASYTSDI